MNVYDFDKTIYDGDSTRDFVFFCIKKYPLLSFSLTKGGIYYLTYKTSGCSKTYFKEKLYSFLSDIPNLSETVEEFWDEHISKIKDFYLKQKQEKDIIISASPRFLLKPACQRLGIKNLIASDVDSDTGFYNGINCFGEEKVRRFRLEFNEDIDEFYSDSYVDEPLAKIAKQAFMVQGDTILKWVFR